MKKILLIILCGVTILSITACGDKQKENSENSKQEKEEIAVTNVYATSNNYLVVQANNKTYIIDNEGKMQGQIDYKVTEDTTITVNNNGYVYYNAGTNGEKYILDKSGKVVYETTEDNSYQYITDNNYTLKESKTSDFENGSTKTEAIVDEKDKIIKEVDPDNSPYYIGGNIWQGMDENGSFLYNEKTNNQLHSEEYDEDYNMYNNPNNAYAISLADGGVFFDENHFITSDLKYASDDDIMYVSDNYYYNKEDYSIYSYDGTKVKEFTSGDGFSHIFSIDNKYYVESGTGYFYTLDKDLNQNEEPYQLEDSITGRVAAVGNNCILSDDKVNFQEDGYEGTWDHFYLYDYEGNLLEDLEEGFNSYSEINNYIIRLNSMSHSEYSEVTGNRETTEIGPQENDKYVNLLTGTQLKVFK